MYIIVFGNGKKCFSYDFYRDTEFQSDKFVAFIFAVLLVCHLHV